MTSCQFKEDLDLFYIIALSISIILLDFKIRELIIIFRLLGDLHCKVINYKILGVVNLYNFDIKFDFIRDHMKKLQIYLPLL